MIFFPRKFSHERSILRDVRKGQKNLICKSIQTSLSLLQSTLVLTDFAAFFASLSSLSSKPSTPLSLQDVSFINVIRSLFFHFLLFLIFSIFHFLYFCRRIISRCPSLVAPVRKCSLPMESKPRSLRFEFSSYLFFLIFQK